MTKRKPSRFEIRLPPELEDRIDEWRRAQPDLPPRAKAARRLIEAGLKAGERTPTRSTKSGGGSDQNAEISASKPAPRKSSAKPAAMSKEARIRALREQGTQ